MSQIVCSTTHVFHYLFNESDETLNSMLQHGLRPLSYFPDSERWQQIQQHAPGMFEWIYENFAQAVIGKPYENSGVFVTPIDFYKLPNTFLHNKRRIAVPLDYIQSDWAAVTYEFDGERKSLPFNTETMQSIAELWHEDNVREWFAKDQTKVFYYVPQIATYQPDGIPVDESMIQHPQPEPQS